VDRRGGLSSEEGDDDMQGFDNGVEMNFFMFRFHDVVKSPPMYFEKLA
jgi:hypothetical protein